MNEYKELISRLRNAGGGCDGIKMCHDAADAIEQLVKERDAAVADLYELFTKDESPCSFCVAEHCDKCIIDYPYWEWRGVQEDNDEADWC